MKKTYTIIFCAIFLIISTRCYNYVLWSSIFKPQYHIEDFCYVVLIIYGWICAAQADTKSSWGGQYIKYLIILPLVSEFLRFILTGDIAVSEISGTLSMCAGLSLFPIFQKHAIDVKYVIGTIVVYASIGFIIQYGENYLNFLPLFGVADETSYVSSRYDTSFNIYRINVCSQLVPVLCVYIFWQRYIEDRKWLNLIPMAIFLVFLYLMQNRQTLIAATITILATPLLITKNTNQGKGAGGIFIIVSVCVVALLLNKYYDSLFGSMADTINRDDESLSTRLVEMPFFLQKSISNPITFLFGNGFQYEVMINQGYRMWSSDVGVIGQLYQYGFVFVLQYFLLLWSAYKGRRTIPLLTKLYLFSTCIHSLFIAPYTSAITGMLWSIVIYYVNCDNLSEIPINEN